jgi:hypothetical protein
MSNKWVISGFLLLACESIFAASPYGNLAFALKQQQIIQSLREHCAVDKNISDEKVRNAFLNDKNNHDAILIAAKAFDHKDTQGYSRAINAVRCPEMKK